MPMSEFLRHPLFVSAERYALQAGAERSGVAQARAVARLVAAYDGRPEVAAAAALHGRVQGLSFAVLRARFGETVARLLAELGDWRQRCGRGAPARQARPVRPLQRLSPGAQSIHLAMLIHRSELQAQQPPAQARAFLVRFSRELALLERAHPLLLSLAHKLYRAMAARLVQPA